MWAGLIHYLRGHQRQQEYMGVIDDEKVPTCLPLPFPRRVREDGAGRGEGRETWEGKGLQKVSDGPCGGWQ